MIGCVPSKRRIEVLSRIDFNATYRAGIIGLQTSVKLLEAGYDVTIVAKHLPGDTSTEYTSPW